MRRNLIAIKTGRIFHLYKIQNIMDITKLKILFGQIHAGGGGYGIITFPNFSAIPSEIIRSALA